MSQKQVRVTEEKDSPKSKHLPRQYPHKLKQDHKDHLQNGAIKSPKSPLKKTAGLGATSNPPKKESSQFRRAGSLAAIPMAGAVVVGTCLGGPVGFLAGLKIGAFVGLGGSLLGYSTANMVEEHWERQAAIQSHYTEMDWRKKSEEVRKERRRRVQEWEVSYEGNEKGKERRKKKPVAKGMEKISNKISFNLDDLEEEVKVEAIESKPSRRKLQNSQELLSDIIIEVSEDEDERGKKLSKWGNSRCKSESSLQIQNVDHFQIKKSLSIDVLFTVY